MAYTWDMPFLDNEQDELSDGRCLFEQLLAEHRDRIFHYIYSIIPSETDAEDICQRSCVVMWRKFSEFDRDRSFLAWANGIAYFEVQNFRRTSGARRIVFSSDIVQALAVRLDQFDRPVAADRLAALRDCLTRLSERDRLLVNEIYWDGQSYDSAAKKCGLSLRTAYNRMHLIRRRLLNCVARKTQFRPSCDDER